MAYNNPIDTKVDLVPELLAKLHREGFVQAVKEFSGDPRRAYRLAELAPELDLLIGADDVLLELAVAAPRAGWPVTPTPCPGRLCSCTVPRSPATSTPRCRCTVSCISCCAGTRRWSSCRRSSCRWTSSAGTAVPCGPPRVPLLPEQEAAVRAATEKAVAAGLA